MRLKAKGDAPFRRESRAVLDPIAIDDSVALYQAFIRWEEG